MKIIIDAMGGDNAPGEIVKGAVDAHKKYGVDVILVGRQEKVRACLKDCGEREGNGIEVVDATEVISMEDNPSVAIRGKKDSSMLVALRLLREGKGDAVVSAGSTGALLVGATLTVKLIKGIRRAALAPVLPNGGKGVVLIDCGANVECTPEYLLQFAYMGSFYATMILGCEKPRVGLLNVGTEETKGDELRKDVFRLLKNAGNLGKINFIGNVEANKLLSGSVDVMVCDGFSGNVLLKSTEGAAEFIMKRVKGVFMGHMKGKFSAMLVRGDMKGLKTSMDASEHGGTALIGISKPVIKSHGSSDARAITQSVFQAIEFINADVVGEISKNSEYMRLGSTDTGAEEA